MELPPDATGTVVGKETTRRTTNYTGHYLPRSDPNLAYRVVGYVEYATALQYLDKLAGMVSEEELEAI